MSSVSHKFMNPYEGSVVPLPPLEECPDLTLPLLNENYERRDGRAPEEIRDMQINLNPISPKLSAGSALLHFGKTVVSASIIGPKLSTARRPSSTDYINSKLCILPMARKDVRRSISGKSMGGEEMALSSVLSRALAASVKPKAKENSYVDLEAVVISDEGGVEAALINVASLALTLSGIEVYDMVTACTVLCFGDDEYLLDPMRDELDSLTHQGIPFSLLTVAAAVNLNKICYYSLNGAGLSAPLLQEAMRIGMEGCRAVYESFKGALSQQ